MTNETLKTFFSNDAILRGLGYPTGLEAPDQGEIYVEKYICTSCGDRVIFEKFVQEHNSCTDCYMDYCAEMKSKHGSMA